MPYPKVPEDRRKRGIGVSLDAQLVRRIEALAGGPGKRSEYIATMLIIGIEEMVGPEWREIADRHIVTDTDEKVA